MTDRAYDMTGRVTALTTLGDGWQAKTGTAFPAAGDGARAQDHAFGWFGGWASKKAQSVVFVRLIQDDHAEVLPAGTRRCDAISTELPQTLASGAHDGAN